MKEDSDGGMPTKHEPFLKASKNSMEFESYFMTFFVRLFCGRLLLIWQAQ